jgi:hypothetical protein
MQFLMLIPNIRFILHENQVLMVQTFRYKGILTYDAKHFDTSIGKDCSNNKFRCSFLRALIWYKILFDIICPLGRVGGRKRLCNTLYKQYVQYEKQ